MGWGGGGADILSAVRRPLVLPLASMDYLGVYVCKCTAGDFI